MSKIEIGPKEHDKHTLACKQSVPREPVLKQYPVLKRSGHDALTRYLVKLAKALAYNAEQRFINGLSPTVQARVSCRLLDETDNELCALLWKKLRRHALKKGQKFALSSTVDRPNRIVVITFSLDVT